MPTHIRSNSRERALARLEGRTPDRLPSMPITMMFAADFAGVKYENYVKDYRVLAEAQLRVAEEFDFDHVSAISDPAREAADCGAKLHWFADQPPALVDDGALLAEKTVLAKLREPDVGAGRMGDRLRGVELLRQRCGAEKLIEGWVEGPCAEAADLRGINRWMTDFTDDPAFVRDLLEFVVEVGVRFATAQIDAGADIIGVGDAAASLVGPRIYREFIWPFEKRLVDAIHARGGKVRLHICGNTRRIVAGMGELGCEMIDLDSPVSLEEARRETRPGQVLAGNLDPVNTLRNGSTDTVREALAECYRFAGPEYIVAAGCEVVRDTPYENVRVLADFARGMQG